MLEGIFRSLDEWLGVEAKSAREQGLLPFKACEFRIVGQTALLQASLNINLAATADVDAFTNAESAVKAKLNELLRAVGLELDPLSNDVWMPGETKYRDFFVGALVKASVAEPIYVLLSKAKKAPEKNRILLRSYLASEPAEEFFALCKVYKVDLAALLKD